MQSAPAEHGGDQPARAPTERRNHDSAVKVQPEPYEDSVLSNLAALVPLALAGAMSTVPASITIMILLSPKPRRAALSFLIGTVAGSIVIVGLSSLGLRFLPIRPGREQDLLLAVLGLLIGVFLIGYSVYLFNRKSQTESALLGKLKSRFQSARPWEYIVLGVGLNLRPKAILLAVTAGALISVQDPPLLQGTLFVLGYAAVAQSAVVLPITLWLYSPERAEVQLTAVFAWLQRNGRTITAVTVLVIGVFVAAYSLLQF